MKSKEAFDTFHSKREYQVVSPDVRSVYYHPVVLVSLVSMAGVLLQVPYSESQHDADSEKSNKHNLLNKLLALPGVEEIHFWPLPRLSRLQ